MHWLCMKKGEKKKREGEKELLGREVLKSLTCVRIRTHRLKHLLTCCLQLALGPVLDFVGMSETHSVEATCD